MSTMNLSVTHGVVVEEEVQFTLVELSRACGADVEQLVALVVEGVLTPSGDDTALVLWRGHAAPRPGGVASGARSGIERGQHRPRARSAR